MLDAISRDDKIGLFVLLGIVFTVMNVALQLGTPFEIVTLSGALFLFLSGLLFSVLHDSIVYATGGLIPAISLFFFYKFNGHMFSIVSSFT